MSVTKEKITKSDNLHISAVLIPNPKRKMFKPRGKFLVAAADCEHNFSWRRFKISLWCFGEEPSDFHKISAGKPFSNLNLYGKEFHGGVHDIFCLFYFLLYTSKSVELI